MAVHNLMSKVSTIKNELWKEKKKMRYGYWGVMGTDESGEYGQL